MVVLVLVQLQLEVLALAVLLEEGPVDLEASHRGSSSREHQLAVLKAGSHTLMMMEVAGLVEEEAGGEAVVVVEEGGEGTKAHQPPVRSLCAAALLCMPVTALLHCVKEQV